MPFSRVRGAEGGVFPVDILWAREDATTIKPKADGDSLKIRNATDTRSTKITQIGSGTNYEVEGGGLEHVFIASGGSDNSVSLVGNRGGVRTGVTGISPLQGVFQIKKTFVSIPGVAVDRAVFYAQDLQILGTTEALCTNELGEMALLTGMAVKNRVNGCKQVYNSATVVDVEEGILRSSDNFLDIFIVAGSVDLTVSGLGGLDTGSVAANSHYYLHSIYNTLTRTSGLIASLSEVTPTFPSGFDKNRVFGAVTTNPASTSIMKFRQFGNGREREILYIEDVLTTLEVLSGGTASSFTIVDLSSFVPKISTSAIILVSSDSSAFTEIRIPGETVTTNYDQNSRHTIAHSHAITNSSQQIEYKVASDDTTIAVQGYLYDL